MWSVYILKCGDGSFYVGHTADLPSRLVAHQRGDGPVYTRYRRPVILIYSEPHPSQHAAVSREKQLKRWSRAKKQALIRGDKTRLKQLSKRRQPTP